MLQKRWKASFLSILFTLFLIGCSERVDDGITLRIWTTESDAETIGVMEDVGRQLQHRNKRVARVEVTGVKWSELNVKLQQAFQADRLPAITHLEPFFTKAFIDQGLLLPVDDIVRAIGENDIHEAVRKIAWFDGHYYGIPQHFGVSFIAYRKDLLDNVRARVPKTWDEMMATVRAVHNPGKQQFAVYFPGGDRFFIDAIFFEALASNGGKAFTSTGEPALDTPQVLETLEYLRTLVSFASPEEWPTASYVDGFPRLVRGQSVISLFAGGRATKTFDEQWLAANLQAPEIFMPMQPPVGPSGSRSYSSVDCEPFSIIDQSKSRGISPSQRRDIETAAKEYLLLLYNRSNYLKLMKTVPIQLIPILKSMAPAYEKDPTVQRWKKWYDQANTMIHEKRVNTYFTTSERDIERGYLFRLYSDRVITDMVTSVVDGTATSAEAMRLAQSRAVAIAHEN